MRDHSLLAALLCRQQRGRTDRYCATRTWCVLAEKRATVIFWHQELLFVRYDSNVCFRWLS
jgi:hypothetical protein